jgi:Mn-containing catalase
MILRIDAWTTELPPPSDPDPAAAKAVQELMGGRFGEMSTFMNYTFQSFNFRGRQAARPFYDLIANIAAEEFGHIELVAAAINSMLTGAPLDADNGGNPQHLIAGGKAALPQDSNGNAWNGDYVFSSGDLVEDLTHNFFLETAARQNKLKIHEMVDHPAARALTGYLLVRGGVHQVAYARAVEHLTGANLTKLFPAPAIPTEKIKECKPHLKAGEHRKLYRFSPDDYKEIIALWNGPHPETGEELVVVDQPPATFPPVDLAPQPDVFAGGYAPEEIKEIATRLRKAAGLPDEPLGEVVDATGAGKTKKPSGRGSRASKAAARSSASKNTATDPKGKAVANRKPASRKAPAKKK